MSKHAKPQKSKHVKTAVNEEIKVYVPRSQLQSEQSEELPQEKDERKRTRAVHQRDFSTGKVWLIIAASLFLVVAWLLPTDGWIRAATLLVPFVLAAMDVFFDTVEAAVSGDLLSKNIVMIIASVGAFLIGRGFEGVLIMILYRALGLIEAYTKEKSFKANETFINAQPTGANLETRDGVINVLPEDVRQGDFIVVNPGEFVPLDGVIVEGVSSVSTSALTGSNKPVTVKEGMRISSGCANILNTIRVRVTAAFNESTAEKVRKLVENAAYNQAVSEKKISHADKILIPVSLAAAILVAFVLPIFSGNWLEWIGRGIILLMVSSLSTLLVSIPISYAGALNNAYYRGILFKGNRYIEALAKTETMAFNKTGTITEGRYTITDVIPCKISEHALLTLAATAEMYSNHPIARALRESCGMLDPMNTEVTQAQEFPGRGVSAFINGKLVYVGNALLLEEHCLRYDIPGRSGMAIHVSMDGRYCGHIIMADRVRDGAFDVLESLRVQGIKNLVMLTGDLRTPAKTTASSLNFDMVKAELSPDNKVSAVEYLMATLADNAMMACVGDAVGDEAMLKRADVGIAMGALTDNIAIDTGNVIIMANDLKKLPIAYKIAKRSYRAVMLNTYISFGSKAMIVFLGVLGIIPIWAAAVLDTAASAALMFNALRTLKSGDI